MIDVLFVELEFTKNKILRMDYKETLKTLFKSVFGKDVDTISEMNLGGSDRKYYRLNKGDLSVVGCFNDKKKENEAFFHIGEVLKKEDINVPDILAISDDELCYLTSDLGNDSLYDLVVSRKEEHLDNQLMQYYKDSLSALAKIQTIDITKFDQSKFYPVASFNRLSIEWDLSYFKYYFLNLNDISYNENRLQADFDVLINLVLNDASQFFMYRDFQSRNIMVKDGELWFIDFQGGRRGPLAYDVVSLLFQAKANILPTDRQILIDHYKSELGKHTDYSIETFDYYFYPVALIRLLQVLGAYGYRGLFQRKSHFLTSIGYALKRLSEVVDNLKALMHVSELARCLNALVELTPKYEEPSDENFLLVVNSFSFIKGGVPNDYSGHGGGYIFDCRALPNPGRINYYKKMTGIDSDVIEFFADKQEVFSFIDSTSELVQIHMNQYLNRGFKYLSVGFGCTGGQHRSVFCADRFAKKIMASFPHIEIQVNHVAQNISYKCQK